MTFLNVQYIFHDRSNELKILKGENLYEKNKTKKASWLYCTNCNKPEYKKIEFYSFLLLMIFSHLDSGYHQKKFNWKENETQFNLLIRICETIQHTKKKKNHMYLH